MSETSATTSRLQSVVELGQQIWRDNLSRELLASGRLATLIAADGVQGLTSNSAVFLNALRHDASCQAALPLYTTSDGGANLPLREHLDEAQAVLARLRRHGIDLDTIGNDLMRAGLTQFE